MRRRLIIAAAAGLVAVAATVVVVLTRPDGIRHAAPCRGPASPAPVAGHPRLFVRAGDLDRLRGRATDTNPVYTAGLAQLAERAKADMDAGRVPGGDRGRDAYEEYPTESYAELFAFLSLVTPDQAARDDYGRRACSLLMDVIGRPEARQPTFATFDRSRWWGEAFPLTIDWAYPYFDAAEKASIRAVFLRWSDDLVHAHTTDHNHPEPIGVTNDPALLADRTAVRWSLNNYYTAHMRNLGLMALAMDDPELRTFLDNATGAWLYVTDHALRTDAAGGLGPEGFEYGPQAIAYVAQLRAALRTAGRDDPTAGNPFWTTFLPALLHSLSPTTTPGPQEPHGPVYQPAWYGSGLLYAAPDMIESLGPLALDAADRGDRTTVEAIRWIEINAGPGGAAGLPGRIDDTEEIFHAIWYFLLLDPTANAPADPRPSLPLLHFAPGTNHLLARTGWGTDASWFTYSLTWKAVDHQRADGNNLELYRKGEWLTKQQIGYSAKASDYHNTLCIQNDPPEHNEDGDVRHDLWRRGSQWTVDPAGDPVLLARGAGHGYVAVTGDATNLYNSTYEGSTDVVEASRTAVWLQPDTIVVYDRAETHKDGRFKRFWLQLPAEPTIDGHRATVHTPGGQQLLVTTLLPGPARLTTEPADHSDDIAIGDPIRYRLRVEDPGQPRRVRFLHVLQGGDGGAALPAPITVTSSAGPGAFVDGTVVLFVDDPHTPVTNLTATLPANVRRVLVTGLQPGAAYGAEAAGNQLTIRATADASRRTDSGGVLDITIA
jgi:hypothetical protein